MSGRVARPLRGRRALVTGATTGIGRATVERLAEDGAAVVVNYIGHEAPAEELVAALASRGVRAAAIRADVGDEEQVAALFAGAARALGGPVDLLVNNAGVQSHSPLVELSLEEWERVLRVNLTGAFLCLRTFAQALLTAGRPGVAVNVSSVHEQVPWPSAAHYCASKAGLKLLGQTAARELMPHGIRVVALAPGAISTERNRGVEDDAGLLAQIPARRVGSVEEVAAAIAWLAAEEASYSVGTTLFLDGGLTLYSR